MNEAMSKNVGTQAVDEARGGLSDEQIEDIMRSTDGYGLPWQYATHRRA